MGAFRPSSPQKTRTLSPVVVYAASSEQVNFNAPHAPHDNAHEAFSIVLKQIKEEIEESRRKWDIHEPRMWSRASGISDKELVGGLDSLKVIRKPDAQGTSESEAWKEVLVLVRSGVTSYGQIILGKIKVGTNDGKPGYVHVR